MNYLTNIDYDLLAKTVIILIVIIGVMYLVYRLLKSDSKTLRTLVKGNFGINGEIPSVPELHFYGKSLGETISIHAFARVVSEKGYDWRDIEVGYRPDFLKNDLTGRNLEIDAYHPKMKVGIEYNGPQHYKFPNVYHKTEEEFERSQERDNLKKKLCLQNLINLIEIPYYVDCCEHRNGKHVNVKRSQNERDSIIYEYIKEQIV